MAKVYQDTKSNLYVYIYSDDHLPPHVHIFVGRKKSRGDKDIKINLGNNEIAPEVVLAHPKIKDADIYKALKLVINYQDQFLEKWREIHGRKTLEEGDN
jgi:Domain of unknown function (DUF4160)